MLLSYHVTEFFVAYIAESQLANMQRILSTRMQRVILHKLTSVNLMYAYLNVKLCIFKNQFTKFGQLIVRKIIKIVATKCQILRLKCTKIYFGGAPPHTRAGGA